MNRPALAPSWLLVAIFICCCGARAALANIDLNTNGMSDIWELLYGNGLDPNADMDGTGMTNFQKSVAGLDPRNAASVFNAAVSSSGTVATISWPSVAGKHYQVEAIATLTSGSWSNIGASLAGTGARMTYSAALTPAAMFFRVVVSDYDSNGDGLSDWEALQLGLNPTNAYSNGTVDGNGQPISDYNYVVAALSATNVISITATKPGATVPDSGPATDKGTFTITRTGNLNAVTVPLGVSGPAVSGSDYAALPASVTLPVGVHTMTVAVMPLAGSHILAGTPVMASVKTSGSYQIGGSGSAAVVIYPSVTPAGGGLTGMYYASSSPTYTSTSNFNPGTLKVTRVDPQVNYFWGQGQPYTKVNRNNFSASWDGQVAPTVTGTYVFGLQAVDGVKLYLSGSLAIDGSVALSSSAVPLLSGSIPLAAGQKYPIHVDYYENSDPASIYLTWRAPGSSSFVTIPTGDIFQPGTSGSTGYLANYYNNTTETGTAAFSLVEKSIFWDWGAGSPDPSIPTTHYSARWLGQVQPQYSEAYNFVTHTSDGMRLWVNGQLITDNWKDQSAVDVSSTTINLQAGVRYNIQLDYYKDNLGSAQAILSWYSPDQAQQVIPQNRLYPNTGPMAPPAITSSSNAVALVGGSFNYSISASNLGAGFTVTGLPPGLTYNPATGTISGVLSQPGIYNVLITGTNGTGAGSSTLTINGIATGSSITDQIWTSDTGTQVSAIPVSTTPSTSGTLGLLAGLANEGNNYGERILGYITAPVTGNYYFWIAANDTAQLWISDDSDPVNKVERASVTQGTGSNAWNVSPTQQSPWLSLVAGQKYYIEVLHKYSSDGGDNVSVGWLRPDQTGTSAAEVVPGYALSPYTPPVNSVPQGTLYSTTLLAQAPAVTDGVGAATLTLSQDQTSATLAFSYSNLTSGVTDTQIQCDPYLNNPTQTIFDITKFAKQNADGSYTFPIAAVGSLSAADVLEIITEGKAYLTIGTVNYPSGELRGNFTLANGAQTFTPPPAAPSWTDDSNTDAGASRFLSQTTFGATPAEIARVESMGYGAWIDDQFTRPASHQLPYVLANPSAFQSPLYPDTLTFNSWWRQSINAPDQLRQRVAFALSEIMVVSDVGALNNNALELTSYYDTLLDNCFGNYENLLKAVTLTPAMGNYLNMRANDKANLPAGLHPDENYAREINQLFSIGLYRLWSDGTLVENAAGSLVPTYAQNTVQGFAAVFTGWNYNQALVGGRLPTNFSPAADYTDPMVLVAAHHDLGQKLTLDNVVLPQAIGSQASSSSTNFDTYCEGDLDSALNIISNHQNVGPFICRELIQRLVTSNPSRGYLYRVAQVFNDDGTGVRGNLQAVVKAILLDYEARSPTAAADPGYGKEREPVLRVTAPARYFASTLSLSGSYSQTGASTILVTSTSANRLANGDAVLLNFTTGTPLPFSGSYSVGNVTANSFTVPAQGLITGTYVQSGNLITVALTSGLAVGNPVYLTFTSGSAPSALYTVNTVPDSAHLTVLAATSGTTSGAVLMEKFTGSYVVAGGTNTIQTSVNHGLNPGDGVFINFSSGTAISGTYPVLSVPDLTHFVISGTGIANQSHNSLSIYPLQPPPLFRSGVVSAQTSTWALNATDGDIAQTPLNAATVFNFYYPGYRFPGTLASAGLTTPEFQLTNATNVMLQNNFLEGGTLGGRDTNGLISFRNGSGAIEMDLGPYLSMTSNASIPSLVDLWNNQFMGGAMTTATRSAIIAYVANTTNYPYSATPTVAQEAARARAVLHLILVSPEYTIQK